ncbi:class I SAM-dependent methyltransferase [Sphingomonas sp. LY54]|uniref:class I SAM-dependent methyltransferase n=1 Tax=Sphingomonas sp. LY54 TaxID=3095343 RepID=UPI002D777F66|nr:class I SAM-dependent methyltransferase [Sphingomonas sp. LY54]WRP29815.1 class I SAM-dependent methyltransferase [Sphingomonas sp. LY54]
MTFEGGSFRDPSGRVLRHEQRVLRAVYASGAANLRAARESGVFDALIERGWLQPAEPLRASKSLDDLAPGAVEWLEHPALDFVSYPYEWCFSALKAAALHHLSFHLELLGNGFTLSDATAYNIQFHGTKPVFIDHLSIVPYEEGSAWTGQRQFGMQFLNPLYLWAKKGLAPHAWYRGALEGIAPEDLARLLGWRDRLSFTVLAHIVGPARFERSRVKQGTRAVSRRELRLPRHRLVAILQSLRDYIAGLALPNQKTVWDDYAENNSYDEARREAKLGFVAEAVHTARPRQLFDMGCNSGDFSQAAIDAGAASVVGFDFDLGALERAFARFDAVKAPVLPLWLDATNPSPAQGWAGAERKSLQERSAADMVLALALIHHLAIARNVPLDMAVDWLIGLAPCGVIEFPSKTDPMVQQLLRNRQDIFADYTEEAFLSHVAARARVVGSAKLGEEGRLILAYDRRA